MSQFTDFINSREITRNESAPKYASWIQEGLDTYAIKASSGERYLNVIATQENIQQPYIGGMQPTVDKEMIYVWPTIEKIRTFKIPRPMNAYMLYRADKHAGLMADMQALHGRDPQNNSRVCKFAIPFPLSYQLLTLNHSDCQWTDVEA